MSALESRSGPAKGNRFNWRLVPLLLLCAAGMAFNAWCACTLFERDSAWKGRNDFMALYASARLAGGPALYDYQAVRAEQLRATGEFVYIQFLRLPVFALLLKLICWMPYHAAYAVWLLIQALSFAAFAVLWPAPGRAARYAVCCWSLPAFVSLFNGQDVLLALFWLTLACWLERRGRCLAAGAALAMCASKYHLFVLTPLVLVAQRRWRMFAGAVTGIAALLALSFAAGPSDWPRSYLAALRDPATNTNPAVMPNLQAMLGSGPHHLWVEIAADAALAAVVFLLARRSRSLEAPLAVSLAAGILVSFHSYMADCALLLPLLTYAVGGRRRLLKLTALALATPVPWFLLHLPPDYPWLTRMLLMVLVVSAFALGLAAPDGIDSVCEVR